MALVLDAGQMLEGSNRKITFTLLDDAGAPVPLSSISAATVTVYDVDAYVEGASPAKGIVNARSSQNVLNTNNVTIHQTSGLVTWLMQPEDTTWPDDVASQAKVARRAIWRHRAVFHFTFSGGKLAQPIAMEIVNGRGV
jgi:hypothetical protein